MVLVTHSLLKGMNMAFSEIHYRPLYPSLTELCVLDNKEGEVAVVILIHIFVVHFPC